MATIGIDLGTSKYVFQGERPMSRDNTSLGELNLDGLAPAPRGLPKIDVTFEEAGKTIYTQATVSPTAGAAEPPTPEGPRVVDADYREAPR